MSYSSFSTLRVEIEDVLRKNILDYWEKYSIDMEYGGFIGHVNFDNSVEKEANKGLILNTRLLWTFSVAANELGLPKYETLATRAYEFLKSFFEDRTYGGVYWELDYTGQAVECKKQIYGQAFAIYALSEYYKCTGDKEALRWARELFLLIEKHSFDVVHDGYVEAFDRDWSALKDMRLSEKDANLEKTMNTHLHILEAYTALYKVWPDGFLKQQLEGLIHVFINHFINEHHHLNLFFKNDWTKVGDIISFGHDIECAWLLTEAVEVIGNKALQAEVAKASIAIAHQFVLDGVDSDGGVLNEREGMKGEYDSDKHWWIQAEALVGLMDAYSKTGNVKFSDTIHRVWTFIQNFMIDHKDGEWYWKVNRDGNPYTSMEKIGFWKCPYHNTRACLEMMKRIDKKEEITV